MPRLSRGSYGEHSTVQKYRQMSYDRDMGKIFTICLFSLFLIALSVQVVIFLKEKGKVDAGAKSLSEELLKARSAEALIESELRYYQNPINFEKELRARFNYRKDGEQFVILVPDNSTDSVSSTQESSGQIKTSR